MPRIRTLKPEHKSHRKVGPLSDRAYRLWVGMITEADDEGRLVAEPAQLRVVVFAYHPTVRQAHVEGALRELELVGLVRRYMVDGVVYADFPSWKDHQRIDRDKASKLPPYNASTSIRRAIDDQSSTSRDESAHIKDQGSRIKEGIKDQGTAVLDASSSTRAARPRFEIADDIQRTLARCPLLGQVARLHDPAWWQAEVRANNPRGVDYVAELLKAEAWLVTNPHRAPKKNHARFVHAWFSRAEGVNGHGAS